MCADIAKDKGYGGGWSRMSAVYHEVFAGIVPFTFDFQPFSGVSIYLWHLIAELFDVGAYASSKSSVNMHIGSSHRDLPSCPSSNSRIAKEEAASYGAPYMCHVPATLASAL